MSEKCVESVRKDPPHAQDIRFLLRPAAGADRADPHRAARPLAHAPSLPRDGGARTPAFLRPARLPGSGGHARHQHLPGHPRAPLRREGGHRRAYAVPPARPEGEGRLGGHGEAGEKGQDGRAVRLWRRAARRGDSRHRRGGKPPRADALRGDQHLSHPRKDRQYAPAALYHRRARGQRALPDRLFQAARIRRRAHRGGCTSPPS